MTYEPDADCPDSDYEAEGLAWLVAHPDQLPKGKRVAYLESCGWSHFEEWRRAGGESWVVRFEVTK